MAGFSAIPLAALASTTNTRDSWHFTLCATTHCVSDPSGTEVTSCLDSSGGDLDTNGDCMYTGVRTGESSYFNDWQSFRKLELGADFIERNCSLLFYTTDDSEHFYCRPDLFVGAITAKDKGACHAPHLSKGLGITAYSLQCDQ